MDSKLKKYETPQLEQISVQPERGFAATDSPVPQNPLMPDGPSNPTSTWELY